MIPRNKFNRVLLHLLRKGERRESFTAQDLARAASVTEAEVEIVLRRFAHILVVRRRRFKCVGDAVGCNILSQALERELDAAMPLLFESSQELTSQGTEPD